MNTPETVRFRWAAGIEDTNIGWPLAGSPEGLDEYALTQHYAHFHEDLRLAAELGVQALRYGFPWYRLNPAPGEWDWSWTDQVVDAAEEAEVELLIDLVHYGTPLWLEGSFTDPRYPEAIAEFGAAVAKRYRGRIGAITPLNEPLVTASFTGLRGIWPPHLHGEEGWAAVVVSVAEGIQRTIRAVRSVAPELEILHVEATHLWTTTERDLAPQLALLEQKNYLPTDLVLGHVGRDHPLRSWLEEAGVSELRLDALEASAEFPDVIGLNYYPELSARDLTWYGDDVVGVTFDGGFDGLAAIADGFWQRYGLPLMISETAVEGSDEHRIAWLETVVAGIAGLMRDGMDVRGIVWWPLFDFVDWSWATGDLVVEEFYTRTDGKVSPVHPPSRAEGLDAYFRRMGLCRLATDRDSVTRTRTPVADAFHALVTDADSPLTTLISDQRRIS